MIFFFEGFLPTDGLDQSHGYLSSTTYGHCSHHRITIFFIKWLVFKVKVGTFLIQDEEKFN